MNSKFYSVAGITIEVRSDFPISENTFHPKFRLFEVDGPGDDNVVINHHFHVPASFHTLGAEAPIFSNDLWKIYRRGTSWFYCCSPSEIDQSENGIIAVFNYNYSKADIFYSGIDEKAYREWESPALTLFNSDQILLSRLLSDRQGCLVHGNGFVMERGGVLFTGVSGAGKSTLSKILKEAGYKILCDDRMVIRKMNDRFFIYGNWCHGSVPDYSKSAAPLKAIFFLEQAKENVIIPAEDREDKVIRIIKTLIRPFLPAKCWNQTLMTIGEITKEIPCFRLRFNLAGGICELMQEHISKL